MILNTIVGYTGATGFLTLSRPLFQALWEVLAKNYHYSNEEKAQLPVDIIAGNCAEVALLLLKEEVSKANAELAAVLLRYYVYQVLRSKLSRFADIRDMLALADMYVSINYMTDIFRIYQRELERS